MVYAVSFQRLKVRVLPLGEESVKRVYFDATEIGAREWFSFMKAW
jgi:hypothetical protein